MDWAVEIPIYQRSECYLFSSERVNVDSVTKDMTPYYNYTLEFELLEMK